MNDNITITNQEAIAILKAERGLKVGKVAAAYDLAIKALASKDSLKMHLSAEKYIRIHLANGDSFVVELSESDAFCEPAVSHWVDEHVKADVSVIENADPDAVDGNRVILMYPSIGNTYRLMPPDRIDIFDDDAIEAWLDGVINHLEEWEVPEE